VRQRVVRLGARAAGFPPPGELFDLWHRGVPWAAVVRSEPCDCGRPRRPHRHRYLECGELHAGLRWEEGACLRLRALADGGVEVDGDLEP